MQCSYLLRLMIIFKMWTGVRPCMCLVARGPAARLCRHAHDPQNEDSDQDCAAKPKREPNSWRQVFKHMCTWTQHTNSELECVNTERAQRAVARNPPCVQTTLMPRATVLQSLYKLNADEWMLTESRAVLAVVSEVAVAVVDTVGGGGSSGSCCWRRRICAVADWRGRPESLRG